MFALLFVMLSIKNLQVVASTLFDAQDRAIFAELETLILDECTAVMQGRLKHHAVSKDFFNQINAHLAEKRSFIAYTCFCSKTEFTIPKNIAFSMADSFGQSRESILVVATGLALPKDAVLYDCFAKDFSEFLENKNDPRFSLKHGMHLIEAATNGQAEAIVPATVFMEHIRKQELSIVDISSPAQLMTVISQYTQKNRLGQVSRIDRVEINGASIVTSEICGLIQIEDDETVTQAAIDQFKLNPKYLIHHTPGENIPILLDQAAVHWINAVKQTPNQNPDFFEQLGNFYWYYSQAMPFVRGSESIAKWMLALIARYHSEEIVYRPAFEFRIPFAMTRGDFVLYFKDNVFLKNQLAELLD
jgi:hypothetical protein